MDIKPKPTQKTEYVVRAGERDDSRAVYRGDSAAEARNVARATPNATITFRSERGAEQYLSR